MTGLAGAPLDRFPEKEVLMEGNGRRGRDVGNAGEEVARVWDGRGEPLDAARGDEMTGLV